MSQRLSLETQGDGPPPAELPSSGRLVLGSGERADLRHAAEGVAPVHCTIGRVKGGGWAIQDLGSDTGTRLNGQRIETARLSPGDRLELGAWHLELVDPTRPRKARGGTEQASTARAASRQPTVAGYRIEKPLGRGGMGHVFLAEQTSLGRRVALKILSPRLAADENFVRRFRAEARAAAALNHPNVVTVFDVGEDGGHHYLSMEYMERGCLESRLASLGPVPWREALDILHDAASGLVYAESKGIVHRDIKPANLMQNEVGSTKIADLGLAVQMEAENEGQGRVQGTPHFIAPEVVQGQPAGPRSDLYSLGATAFRLLSGRTPFEGSDAREILRNVLTADLPDLRQVAPDVPPALAELVQRLLARDPAGRPAGAAELQAALATLRQGGGAAAAAPRPRRSLLPALVGTVAVLAAAGAGLHFSGLLGGTGDGGPDDVEASSPRTARPTVAAGKDGAPGEEGAPAFEEGLFESGEQTADTGPTETDLRLFELNAENAFLALRTQELTDEERIERLRALATEFAGTDAALQATMEAESIASAMARAAEAEEARAGRLAAARRTLEAAAGLDADPWRLAPSLQALLAAPLEPNLVGDPEVEAERQRLLAAALDRARREGEAALERAAELRREGRFDELRSTLETWLERSSLPEAPEDGATPSPLEGLAGLEALRETRKAAEAPVANLELDRLAWRRRKEREDREALSRGLGLVAGAGDAGLLGELRRLDLSAAAARLGGLATALHGEAPRALAAAWQEEVRSAASILETVGRAASGGWRRRTVLDPRDGRPIEAVGGDGKGLLLEAPGGSVHVPWSAWGNQPAALHQLFHARLERDWTAEERRAVATLLRLCAVAAGLDLLSGDLERRSAPGERDRRKLDECFEDALDWAREAGSLAPTEAEHDALRRIASALLALEEGNPSLAIHALEETLERHPDTLVVRLLSDGSEWREAPPAPSSAPGGSDAAEAPSGDGGDRPR